MTLRGVVFYLYLITFLIGIGATLMIPETFWRTLMENQPWLIAFYVYPLLMAFCGVLMAYWIARDDIKIDRLERENRDLRRRLEENHHKKSERLS